MGFNRFYKGKKKAQRRNAAQSVSSILCDPLCNLCEPLCNLCEPLCKFFQLLHREPQSSHRGTQRGRIYKRPLRGWIIILSRSPAVIAKITSIFALLFHYIHGKTHCPDHLNCIADHSGIHCIKIHEAYKIQALMDIALTLIRIYGGPQIHPAV